MASIYDFIIVGAGLTGLNLARQIQEASPKHRTLILEKSKSCGGRMATRRINDLRFDHGAQFIEYAEESKDLIQTWESLGLIQKFPLRSPNTKNTFCGKSGITALAKQLAQSHDIKYEIKIVKIECKNNHYVTTAEDGTEYFGRHVILTPPLPQCLDVLKNSQIAYDENLHEIIYNKSIVFLVEGHSAARIEAFTPSVLAVTDQQLKNNSLSPAWTIVMNDQWSCENFDSSDEEILKAGKGMLENSPLALAYKEVHLKKWRFATPKTKWRGPFYKVPSEKIDLAGDSFGGPDLIGSLVSSVSVFKALSHS